MTGSSDLGWGLGKIFPEEVTSEQRAETSKGVPAFQAITSPHVKAERDSLLQGLKGQRECDKGSHRQRSSR